MNLPATVPSFWSPVVGGLSPYVPGEQPKIDRLVKLNTNENPYPPSPRVVEAIRSAAERDLQLYPDPESVRLRETIAAYHGLDAGQVFVGNGSDEVLGHAFFAFFQQAGAPLLMPDISYSFYKVYCGLYAIPVRTVPLDARLQVDVEGFAPESGLRYAGAVVAHPNAPTGSPMTLEQIERLLALHPDRVVLVDEAYVDFGSPSAIGLIDRHPNLLVVHTLSKSRSLAGLRVGFACGQRHLIEGLERVKNSFNSYPLDRLATVGAMAAFEDEAWFQDTRRRVMASRESLARDLEASGFEVVPSQANFVFVRHPSQDAATLALALRRHGVLVRHFATPRIAQYLRISVGTPEQCEALLRALRVLLAEAPAA